MMIGMDAVLHEPTSVTSPGLAGHRPSAIAHRLHARWARPRLDREIADGCGPERSPAHAVRARQLADPALRHDLADRVRRLVDDAGEPHEVLYPVRLRRSTVLVSLRSGEVSHWREGLLGLADRLEGRDVDPVGVARALVLLGDGAGPLYNVYPARALGESLWWIADRLDGAAPPAAAEGRPASVAAGRRADPESVHVAG